MPDRLTQLLELLEESPRDSFLLFAVAKEYEKQDDLEQALDYYKRLEQTDPQYVGLYYHLGKLLETLGEPKKALHAYRRGMDISSSQNDQHSYSELINAKTNLELEM